MRVRLQVSFPALPQGLGVKPWPLGGIDLAPVGVDLDAVLEGASEPVHVDGGESLPGEIDAAALFRSLASAMAPDKGGVCPAIVREGVVGGDASLGSLEGSDREGHIPGDHPRASPFPDDLNIQRLASGVIFLPQIGHIPGDLLGALVGREGFPRTERMTEKDQDQGGFHQLRRAACRRTGSFLVRVFPGGTLLTCAEPTGRGPCRSVPRSPCPGSSVSMKTILGKARSGPAPGWSRSDRAAGTATGNAERMAGRV